MPVSLVSWPLAYFVLRQASLLVEPEAILMLRKIEFEGIGFLIAIQGATNELSGFHHLESNQAVKMSECHLLHQLVHSLRPRETRLLLIIEKLLQARSRRSDLWQGLDRRQPFYIFEFALAVQAVNALQQVSCLIYQKLSRPQSHIVDR